jgi:hypothetical protein
LLDGERRDLAAAIVGWLKFVEIGQTRAALAPCAWKVAERAPQFARKTRAIEELRQQIKLGSAARSLMRARQPLELGADPLPPRPRAARFYLNSAPQRYRLAAARLLRGLAPPGRLARRPLIVSSKSRHCPTDEPPFDL